MNKVNTIFCTISTNSHAAKTTALAASLVRNGCGKLQVLYIDEFGKVCENTVHYSLDELTSAIALAIKEKYKKKTNNELRWALKPVFMQHMLALHQLPVVYIDNDLVFYNYPIELVQLVDKYKFVLHPHFYDNTPINPLWFEANFWVGLYNAGILGVGKNGAEILTWWSTCCLYNMKRKSYRGLFDDQKYLDLIPIAFEDIAINKHPGYNIAGWNIELNKRSIINNKVVIRDNYPLVCIHFAPLTVQKILLGEDDALKVLLQEYIIFLKLYGWRKSLYKESIKYKIILAIRFVRWKIERFFE